LKAEILKLAGTLKFPDQYNIQLDHYYTSSVVGIDKAEKLLQVFTESNDIKQVRHIIRFSDVEIFMKRSY